MKNLGEILQEARKAKGISLRDAADATKIRTDFLAAMEDGSFDIDLPEIYKRGFLRLYAEFLGLDESQIMADYNAFFSAVKAERDASKGNSVKSQFLSRMAAESEEYDGTRPPNGDLPNSDFSNAPAYPLDGGDDKPVNSYMKIAAVLAGLVVLVAIIVFIGSKISSSSDNGAPVATATLPEFTISITALSDTAIILSLASDESVKLFSGELRANDKKEFKTKEPLTLRPKDHRHLKVERNGVDLKIADSRPAVKYNLRPPESSR